jgi:hypothetical protein
MEYYIFLRFIFLPGLQPTSVFYAPPPLDVHVERILGLRFLCYLLGRIKGGMDLNQGIILVSNIDLSL